MEESGPHPLPDDPALAAAAAAMRDGGYWADIVDAEWRLAYMSDAFRQSMGDLATMVPAPIGAHYFGPELVAARLGWRNGPNRPEFMRLMFSLFGPWALYDTPGGRAELEPRLAEEVRPMLADLEPCEPPAAATAMSGGVHLRETVHIPVTAIRIRRADGSLAGTLLSFKPEPSMSVLGAMTASSDLGHIERMQRLARAGRRPGAILFADLEHSSRLSRRLPTAAYFALGRRLVRAADACVVEAGGIVGRHVGDGTVAFFPVETAGSESAAARDCIAAARALRLALAGVARRSELDEADVVLRFGLHWGATLYMGQVTTRGRMEVTALGDQVNEAARIEACAVGGRALASKDLVERLDPADAAALGLDPDHLAYTRLADLDAATEKARRDAPDVAVCDV